MPIRFDCPACGTHIRVRDDLAGRRGRCPNCQGGVVVPELKSAPGTESVSENASSAAESKPSLRKGEIQSRNKAAKQSEATKDDTAVNDPSSERSSPAVRKQLLSETVLAAIQRPISPVRTSFLYQIAIILVAVAVVILPVLYVVLIVMTGYGVYWHTTENTSIATMGRGRGRAIAVMIYLAPIVAGVILILFMLKPLFAPARGSGRRVSITRARQGLLFAFIEKLCDSVHSPRPSRIELNFQLNAGAGLGDGILSLFRRQPVLHIGLPLVAGLSLQQFSGILAHEFGHFSQGLGMRASFVIRSINHWFARVVYERDEWDAWLIATSEEVDVRIGFIFYFARMAVFISRMILWCFMITSHAVSCWLGRQMEFDADLHEIRFSGSAEFPRTALRLQILNAGFVQFARSQTNQREHTSLNSGNPIRDMIAHTEMLDEAEIQRLKRRIDKGRTGWFDTHPSDSDRIRRAEKEAAPGVFQSDLPAEALFSEFDQLCHALMRA